jgi:Holliday junction resolvase-like predicted endonuclease
MTPRQCEIAAESFAASLFAQAGYDILVQYGANQPHYDLVAVKDERILMLSVKGSQDGGWMLASRFVKPGIGYHNAIDRWLEHQRKDLVFVFVQFKGISIGQAPRVYLARPTEIAEQLKLHRNGQGHGALQEDWQRDHPRSRYADRIPPSWTFSVERINAIA